MSRIFIAVIALGLAGAIFFGYTKPNYDKSQQLRALAVQYDEALAKANELQQLKQSLLSRFNSFNPDDIDRLQKLLPDHVDNVRLVLDLNNMAARYGLGLQNVNVTNPEANAASQPKGAIVGQIGGQSLTYDSLELKFSTAGTYANLVSFLKDLESSMRIVDIEHLAVQPGSSLSKGGGEPTYQYDITIRTYWLK